MPDKWKPIKVTKSLTFTGGLQSKHYALETKEIETGSGAKMFVKIEKQSEWLYKAAAGKQAGKHSLKRTTLVEALRKRLKDTVDQDSQSAVAEEGAATSAVADGGADPMLQLVPLPTDNQTTPTKRRASYVSKRSKNRITEVDMPEQESRTHPSCATMRKVRLLAMSTNSLWIAVEDVDWLVTWLAAEVASGGVSVPEVSDPFRDLDANCQAPGVHMRWDFDGAWEAIVISGTKQGKKVVSYVHALTPDKWTMAAVAAGLKGPLATATPEQRKQATFVFLELHMKRLVEEADEPLMIDS